MPSPDQCVQLAALVLLRFPDTSFTAGEIAEHLLTDAFRPDWASLGLSSWQVDRHELAMRLGKALKSHANGNNGSTGAIQGRSNNTWTFGNGVRRFLTGAHADFQDISRMHLGMVGEFAVISELLARGWNAGKLPVDDGVDVVATRDKELRTFQVKTARAKKEYPEEFSFTIDVAAHERFAHISHFYMLVMRRYLVRRWVNDFLIIRSNDLMPWTQRDDSDGIEKLHVSVSIEREDYLLGSTRRVVSDHVNDFRLLG